ncbi:alaserpin [Bactrocera dorsalis]|uniref:Alaserpin n=1 Tax=Bactrocera dorsalis TaxID=27457 RepID=A0A6I9VFT6_BACDO|nr:alaserpin [Bactrocera dorsalis]
MFGKTLFTSFTLWLLCSTKHAPALAATTTDSSANATDLMHLLLAHILAEADAARNFVIAPQEMLELYLQLHGTVKEIATAAATQHGATSNEVTSADDSGMQEFEEFFHITGSPILVNNTLYADVYNAQRFTRKLKNLQFVLYNEGDEEESEEPNKSSDNTSIEDGDDKGRKIDNNDAAVASNSHTSNSSSKHNKNKHNRNNNIAVESSKRNELINVVRINSRWAHNFQKRDTHKRQFYMPQTHTHAYLNAMRKDDIFLYGELPQLNASALELSLQRQQLKMLIILPQAKHGLPQLLRRLSANVTLLDDLCGLTGDTEDLGVAQQQQQQRAATTGAADHLRGRLESTLVRVFLPQFKFAQRTNLDGAFKQLLNATANVDLHWPSAWQVTQEAHFAVSEDGIGELEESMVLFWNAFSSLRSKPLMFCVDHPFFFIVYNRRGIQFLGHLAQLHE